MPKPKLLYMGRSLPCLTETFVFNEILELKKQGWQVETVSVHAPEKKLGSRELGDLADSAITVYPQGVLLILFRFLKELIVHPSSTIRTLWHSWITCWRTSLSWLQCCKVMLQSIAALSIAEKIREKKIEHIHAHMAHVPTTMAWVLGYQLNLPFSFTGHAADIFRDQILLHEKLRSAQFCACVSRWHRHFYQKILPVSDRRLPVIRCSVDRDQFKKGVAQEGLILSVGRLVPKKGFQYLIQACEVLRTCGCKFQCLIIGDGSERASLEKQVKALGLENTVQLLGAKTHREIKEFLAKAELFILPCVKDEDGDRDGIPLVLMEAMASSVPVISGDLPTIRELILDKENGLIVNPKNINEMASNIQSLLLDKELKHAFIKKGLKMIESEYDLSKNVTKLGTVFKEGYDSSSSPKSNRKLLIVSPCRNEGEFLERSIKSVLNQTVLPATWVIVDDGSTDETPEILVRFSKEFPVIKVIHRTDRGTRKVGPGVIEAFYEGLESQQWQEYDYICKLDLDLELPSDYFESLIEIMEMDPRMGTCSGKAYYKNGEGKLVSEKCGDEMSQGMTKLYRTQCFDEIGGFVEEVMWDGIDCHRCRMLGWQAASWDDPKLRFIHLRPMGSSQNGIITGRMRHGFGQYFMGTSPVYMLVSAFYRMFLPPFVVGGISMFLGYFSAWWQGVPRYNDREFQKFLRSYQWNCLLKGKRRATAQLDRMQEKVWLEKHSQD